jgi:VIT1/CCC1 family predicted Fe2+/Mn2+ transporter
VNREQRTEATLGAFDGTVSIVGIIFGLLIHHASSSTIAVGAIGGAVAATISMTAGVYESVEGTRSRRVKDATAMALATLVGSLVPVWPFLVFGRVTALVVASIGCFVVAGWIGRAKAKGVRGFIEAYLTLLAAAGLTLLIVAAIPASA